MNAKVKLTADTITDAQILELLDEAAYREWRQVVADCYVALHGVQLPTRPRQKLRRAKEGAAYHNARARCAEILNARSSK